MGNKIIITKYKNSILTSMHDGKRLIQLNLDSYDKDRIYGNIYIGKVKNIIKNINAAFVEIANGVMCYLSLQKYETPIFIRHGKKSEIQVGDELLVQVSREEMKTKAPTVTTGLSFTGKYLVLTGNDCTLAVSSKIEDSKKRKQLKVLMESFLGDNYGFIIRTNAMYASEDNIKNEARELTASYLKLISSSTHKTCYSLLYEAVPAFLCTIRDSYSDQVDEFITDNTTLFARIQTYLGCFQKEDIGKLTLYQSELTSLDAVYHISGTLECCYHEKVWLKSGGSLIIQTTEALTAIDVNTEKAIKARLNTQELFYRINREAAAEIAYQLRLRNISGIIMIDFIDMTDPCRRKELMDILSEMVKDDPVKTSVIDMTALNLVELTRKKTRKPLLEQLNEL